MKVTYFFSIQNLTKIRPRCWQGLFWPMPTSGPEFVAMSSTKNIFFNSRKPYEAKDTSHSSLAQLLRKIGLQNQKDLLCYDNNYVF